MTTGEYLVARPPHDESEHVYLQRDPDGDPELHRGWAKVTIDLVVKATSPDAVVDGLRKEMADRDIDPDECHGLQGFSEAYEAKYPNWGFDKRLGPSVAVIWHPKIIVPPAIVLDERAVIYGALVP